MSTNIRYLSWWTQFFFLLKYIFQDDQANLMLECLRKADVIFFERVKVDNTINI